MTDVKPDKEIWKDIKGFKGRYQISNHGRVKSLARIVSSPKGYSRNQQESILMEIRLNGSLLLTVH